MKNSPSHVFKETGLRQSVGGAIDEIFSNFPVFLMTFLVSQFFKIFDGII